MDLPEDSGGSLLAEAKAGDNAPALSVTELSMSLKRTIETSYGRVRVRGEISGFKRHASGHCYFSLKDEGACMDAVVWRSSAQNLAFRPEDGAEVIATGKLTTYPGRSKYQIMVERMELAGEGALMALLDKRHQRPLARQLHPFDDDLVLGPTRIGGQLSRRDDLRPVLGTEAERLRRASPDDGVHARPLVLQREIAVARSVPLEPGDFAAHPDTAVGRLDCPLERHGQFGH